MRENFFFFLLLTEKVNKTSSNKYLNNQGYLVSGISDSDQEELDKSQLIKQHGFIDKQRRL